MKEEILETIAVNSIFGMGEVSRVYDIFKSFDLLVAGCQWCQTHGTSNLELACILVKAKNDNDEDTNEGVFHMEYIDFETIRLTRLEKEKS